MCEIIILETRCPKKSTEPSPPASSPPQKTMAKGSGKMQEVKKTMQKSLETPRAKPKEEPPRKSIGTQKDKPKGKDKVPTGVIWPFVVDGNGHAHKAKDGKAAQASAPLAKHNNSRAHNKKQSKTQPSNQDAEVETTRRVKVKSTPRKVSLPSNLRAQKRVRFDLPPEKHVSFDLPPEKMPVRFAVQPELLAMDEARSVSSLSVSSTESAIDPPYRGSLGNLYSSHKKSRPANKPSRVSTSRARESVYEAPEINKYENSGFKWGLDSDLESEIDFGYHKFRAPRTTFAQVGTERAPGWKSELNKNAGPSHPQPMGLKSALKAPPPRSPSRRLDEPVLTYQSGVRVMSFGDDGPTFIFREKHKKADKLGNYGFSAAGIASKMDSWTNKVRSRSPKKRNEKRKANPLPYQSPTMTDESDEPAQYDPSLGIYWRNV